MLYTYFKRLTSALFQSITLLLLSYCTFAQTQIYQHNFGTTPISAHPYTVAPGYIDPLLSGSAWSNSSSAWSIQGITGGSSGVALKVASSTPSMTVDLTFTVASGQQLDITHYNFWSAYSSSGYANWNLSINGTQVGSGVFPNLGLISPTPAPVGAPITGLTGTVTVSLTLTNSLNISGSNRIDDFQLFGTVTPLCAGGATIASFSPANAPANTKVTINGSGFTGASHVKFGGIDSTEFNIISDTVIEARVPSGAVTGPVTVTVNGCNTDSATNLTRLESSCTGSTLTEIYISELYDEKSFSGGLIEIYNPGNTTVNLTGYTLLRYGIDPGDPDPTSPSNTLNLTGSIAPNSVYLVSCSAPVNNYCAVPTASQNLGSGFNGLDKFELLKNGSVIDMVRIPFTSPGFTLIRKPVAIAPKTTYDINDWNNTQHPTATNPFCSTLGAHTATSNPTTPPVITPPVSRTVCENGTTTYSVTVTPTTGLTYQWKVLNAAGVWVNVANNANYSGATTSTLTLNGIPVSFNNNQYYCHITSANCTLISDAAQLEVVASPVAAVTTLTHPTCSVATGSIAIMSPLGLEYSIDGTTFQAGTTFSNLPAGTYTVTVRNTANCTSTTSVIINPATGAPAVADVTITQPTCAVPTGTITVNSPLGAGLTYSIDGTTFGTATTFANLPSGNYVITVKDASDCTSVTPIITINTAPATPAVATVSVTQPTCTTATGSIVVTAPLGNTYSIDGTTYQPGTVFSNLPQGSYVVYVRNSDGCVSTTTAQVINAAPAIPAVAAVSVTQPTCANPTGTITVTSPVGNDYNYSLNGLDFYLSPVFSNLAPGTYNITVRNSAGCTSVTPNITIDPAPAVPAQAIASIIQPTCTTPTGTITVNSPVGADITYSINGIDFQASPMFAGLVPGTYNITVINGEGCSSLSANYNVETVPVLQPAATNVVQPTCVDPTGTITVTVPIGPDYNYSLNGIDFQSSEVFSALAPGNYNITIQDISGCSSVSAVIIINPVPASPDVADVTVTHPSCTIPQGTITVNSPLGTGLEYSINGIDFQSYNIFNVPEGNYNVTVRNTGGCTSVSANITINPIPNGLPPVTPPAPLVVCDDNNDGFAEFNLTGVINAIESALADVTVTIHETSFDAGLGYNEITNINDYTNINPVNQTLYIRIESDVTGCYDIVTLQLIVNPLPVATTPSDYELCDDAPLDTDGHSVFRLVSKNAEILGSLDPAQYTVSYHESLGDAQSGTPFIANAISYDSASRTIYGRVTNSATGCFDIVELSLIVNPLPVLLTDEHKYSLCESGAPLGVETFDLTSVIPVFVSDAAGLTVSFHRSVPDADNNANAIPQADTFAYENQSIPVEFLVVRITNSTTGCYRLAYLDIRVEPEPIVLPPSTDELTVCDTNGQGIGNFDLAALVEGMANGDPNLVITFHESAPDAQSGANPIPDTDSYENIVPYLQTIYVRVVDTRSGCANTGTISLDLIVEPAPQAPALADLTFCDDEDDNGQNSRRLVDLTVQDAAILAALGAAPGDVNIEYYSTEAGARSGLTGRLIPANAYMGTDGQQIWVRVEDPVTECYSVEDFFLHFDKPHPLVTPSPLTLCDDATTDGLTVFDLTVKDNEILGPAGVGQDYTVAYYTLDQDPENNAAAVPIATPDAYTNTVNPQNLIVRVTTDKGCHSYTSLLLRVLPLPVIDMSPDPLVMCDLTAPAGVEDFNLRDAEADISDNGQGYFFSYHILQEDAENGINAIATPDAYSSASGSVWVRVEKHTSNAADPHCYKVVELELILNPLPPVGGIRDYAQCVPNPVGTFEFNIKAHVEEGLGVDPSGYEIDYFTDAALTTPAIPVTAYPVTGGTPVTVYVRIVDRITSCEVVLPLQLIVEQEAIANQPAAATLHSCDTDGTNDGFFSSFDLTVFESQILGTQNPADYSLTYHLSQEEAQEGDNPIATPAAFTNTVQGGQVIWVRVIHNQSIGGCDALAQITVEVEELPRPQLTGATLCVDYTTGIAANPVVLDTGLDATHTFVWTHNGAVVAGATGPTLTLSQKGEEGIYNVTATSSNGCVSEPIADVEVLLSSPASPIGKGYIVTNAFSDNQTIIVRVQGYGDYQYRLDEQGDWQQSNIFTNVPPGTHTVYVRDTKPGACDMIALEGASVIDYPNFFTPNGDGFNDTWNIIGLQETGSVIYIFDRYGKLIKQISADSDGWDGTFNGNQLPADDYWFTVTYPEFDGVNTVTKEFKAHFSLKR